MVDHIKATFELHVAKMALPQSFQKNAELDACLLIVYKIATCEDGKLCRKGDHILESLSGRAYNLAISAMILSASGLYDESLNSVRSLGELANVLAFLTLHPDEYPNWVSADKKTRISKYSPSAIRKAINDVPAFGPPMDKDTYAEICELSTHVHGATAPNAYESGGLRHVGGFQQQAGDKKVADLLTYTMSMIALLASKMVGREDLFKKATDIIR